MEAELVRELPRRGRWQYEPKWDGFRGVLENDGGELALWSRNERPLLRYFPELRPLGDLLPPHSALDGEIVIERGGRLDFDSMQIRLHPAESRIRKLSGEIPAQFVAFDVLLWEGEPVHRRPLEERRRELERLAGSFRISPATRDRDAAEAGSTRLEAAGLDGVIAKRLGLPYLPGSREGVVKVKAHRTRGLRRRRRALEGAARPDSRRSCSASTARTASWTTSARARSPPAGTTRSCDGSSRCSTGAPERGFSEPNRWGTGELEQSGASARARRRGALRQGAGQPVPPRHAAAAFPATTRIRGSARGARFAPPRADDLTVPTLSSSARLKPVCTTRTPRPALRTSAAG